jgi:hypothetical protein
MLPIAAQVAGLDPHIAAKIEGDGKQGEIVEFTVERLRHHLDVGRRHIQEHERQRHATEREDDRHTAEQQQERGTDIQKSDLEDTHGYSPEASCSIMAFGRSKSSPICTSNCRQSAVMPTPISA